MLLSVWFAAGLAGALAMAAFGLGTTPLLAVFGLGVRRVAGQRAWTRRALALLVLVTGLWMVVQRHGKAGMAERMNAAPAAVQDSTRSHMH